ncbi:MAG: DUF4411 family protein [Victivallales bacterium]|nr:DUF4411 family protein [Victivallales bacterium]
MAYLLDTNVFIDAAETYYASDICPSFWRWLPHEEKVRSIKEVKDELLKGNDSLSRWIKAELPNDFFSTLSAKTRKRMSAIADYVLNRLGGNYSIEARQEFLQGADAWLVAAAMENDDVIVTHEKRNIDHRETKKVYLPTIATAFNIRCMRIYQVLRELQIVLG